MISQSPILLVGSNIGHAHNRQKRATSKKYKPGITAARLKHYPNRQFNQQALHLRLKKSFCQLESMQYIKLYQYIPENVSKRNAFFFDKVNSYERQINISQDKSLHISKSYWKAF